MLDVVETMLKMALIILHTTVVPEDFQHKNKHSSYIVLCVYTHQSLMYLEKK